MHGDYVDLTVDRLHVDVLKVIRGEQLYIISNLLQLLRRQLNLEQVPLLVKPAHLYLREVGMFRVGRADGHNFPQQVWHVRLLEETTDVAYLEDLIAVLEPRIHFLLVRLVADVRSGLGGSCGCGRRGSEQTLSQDLRVFFLEFGVFRILRATCGRVARILFDDDGSRQFFGGADLRCLWWRLLLV